MTSTQIPAFKTQQIWEYFGRTKEATFNLNGIQPGVPASGSILDEDVFFTGIPPAFIESFVLFLLTSCHHA